MTIVPRGKRVLVKRDQAPEMTEGGIALPTVIQQENRPLAGIVEQIGPGVAGDLKVGDHVLFNKWAGTDFGDVLLLSDEDIVAVTKE